MRSVHHAFAGESWRFLEVRKGLSNNLNPIPKLYKGENLENTTIHVIGEQCFLHNLIVQVLAKETGLACQNTRFLAEVDGMMRENDHTHLILVNKLCHDSMEFVWDWLAERKSSKKPSFYLVLFNIPEDWDQQERALQVGVHGIVFSVDSMETMIHCIRNVLEGSLWFSRKVMSMILSGKTDNNTRNNTTSLTLREKEILLMLISGSNNKKIARDIDVSVFTVKSHVYNIYKKIGVSNRLEATLWASKHL